MKLPILKNYLDALIKEYNVPSVDCIVKKDNRLIFRYMAGVSDLETKKPISGDELYLIFSMTKMLTCTAALTLYEQGEYCLDDPLAEYMPEFEKMKVSATGYYADASSKIMTGDTLGETSATALSEYAKNPIRIRDLFTMSAGLDYDLGSESIKAALAAGKTSTNDLVSAFSGKTLCFEPGTRFKYSLCHDVLGALIEIWSGVSLGEYMRKRIFEPLGMENTFFNVPKDKERLSRMATLYRYDEARHPKRVPLECPYNLSENYESGGAGLVSCTHDYSLFLDALASGKAENGYKLLSSATIELMGTNHLFGERAVDFENLVRKGYGYGLGVRVHANKAVSGSLSPLGEFGWDGAAGSFSMVDTKNKLSLTYFQHVFGWDTRIQHGLRNALYADLF